MAFLPRSRLFRLLGTDLRSRTAPLRPAPISRWSYLAAVSSSTWSGVQNAASDLQFCQRQQQQQQQLQRRGYASGSGTISLVELKEGVFDALKLFDRMKVMAEAHLISDLDMDSLDGVGVVTAFKDKFGVEISDEEAENGHTCKDAREFFQLLYDPK